MVEIYCAHHATCPFYKFWRDEVKDDKQLIPITSKFNSFGCVYSCRALQHCSSPIENIEKFLGSLTPPINFNNCRTQFEECSVISTLNEFGDLLSKIKRAIEKK